MVSVYERSPVLVLKSLTDALLARPDYAGEGAEEIREVMDRVWADLLPHEVDEVNEYAARSVDREHDATSTSEDTR